MNIEPLRSILSFSMDKKNTLLYFLSEKNREIIKNLDYEEKEFYLNDSIIGIKKNTLELDIKGRIIYIEDNVFGIKITSMRTIKINPNNYYLFIKNNKTINTKRNFMKELLKQI